jgi:membrane associated rhomboid family serine protease
MGFSLVPEEITTFQDLQGTKVRQVWVQPRTQRDSSGSHHAPYVSKSVTIQHYPGPVPICLTLLTSMFMHGSFLHLFFNMWSLLIFGRNVECAMGHKRFLAFYLACGVLAGLAHVASDPHSIIPYLGASGAIAGTMGAYISIYPLNRIKIWVGLLFGGIVEAPALFVIGLWVLLQYFSAVIEDTQMGGIAYWAHLGGFFAGFIILRVMVFNLKRMVAASAAAKQTSLAPGEQSAAASPVQSAETKPAPDPYEGFITMQTIRQMKEKKKQENSAAQ